MSRHDNEDRVYGTAQSARRCAVAFGVDRLVASGGPAWGTDPSSQMFTAITPLGIPGVPVAVDSRCSSSTVDLALRLVLHLRQRMPATAAARLVQTCGSDDQSIAAYCSNNTERGGLLALDADANLKY